MLPQNDNPAGPSGLATTKGNRMIRLHRDEPPGAGWTVIEIGTTESGPVILGIDPRALDWPHDADPLPEFFPAFVKSCARIWGQQWHAGLERAAGLRKGTASQWMKRGQIPPPVLVAWVAYICARPDARAIGRFLDGLAETKAPKESFAEAVLAFEGMNR